MGEGRLFPHEILVEAEVTTAGGDFLVHLKVGSEGKFVCDRCGEEFQRDVRGEVRTLFTFDTEKVQGEGNGEIRLLHSSAQEINITQDALDAFLLAVPAKCLCREECLGLCPRCGANLNKKRCSCFGDEVDSRWETLKGLKFEE